MNPSIHPAPARIPSRTAALLLAGLLAVTGALAEKPEGAGGGKHGKKARPVQGSAQGDNVRVGGYFQDGQRNAVRSYYTGQASAGRCPPGLAKKNNGCLPPGQARKWALGQPLPRDVVYYSVPPAIAVQLGAPPSGHRYVRVATDILLIAIGTAMVVDAIQDLGGM